MYEDIDLFDNTRGDYNIDNSSDDELNTMYKNVISVRFGGKFVSKSKDYKQKNDNKENQNHDIETKHNKKSQPKSLSELLERISSDINIEKSGGKYNDQNIDKTIPKNIEDDPDSIFDVIDIPSERFLNEDSYNINLINNIEKDIENNPDLFKTKTKLNKTKKKGGNNLTVVDSSPNGLEYTKDIKHEELPKEEDKDYIKFVNEQKYGSINEIGDPENTLFNYTSNKIDEENNNIDDKLPDQSLTDIVDIADKPINNIKSNISIRSKSTLIDTDKTLDKIEQNNDIEQNDDNIDSLFKD